jgi:hypothetical protein
MSQHPDPDVDDVEAFGTPVYQGSGLSVRALSAEEVQRFLDAQPRPARPVAGGRLGRPRPTGASLWGSPDPSGGSA